MEPLEKLEYRVIDELGAVKIIDHSTEKKDYLKDVISKYSELTDGDSFYELTKLVVEEAEGTGRIKAKGIIVDSEYFNWIKYINLEYAWDGKTKAQLRAPLLDINSRFYYDKIVINSFVDVLGGLFNDMQVNQDRYNNTGFDAISSLVRSFPDIESDLENSNDIKQTSETLADYLYALPGKRNLVAKHILTEYKNKAQGKGFDKIKLYNEVEPYLDKKALRNAFVELYLLKENPKKEETLGFVWDGIKNIDEVNKGNPNLDILNYRDFYKFYKESLSYGSPEEQKKWFVQSISDMLGMINFDNALKLRKTVKIEELISKNKIHELTKRVTQCCKTMQSKDQLRNSFQDIYDFTIAFLEPEYFISPGKENIHFIPSSSGNEIQKIKDLKSKLERSLSYIPAKKMDPAYPYYKEAKKILENYIEMHRELPVIPDESESKKIQINPGTYDQPKKRSWGKRIAIGLTTLITLGLIYHGVKYISKNYNSNYGDFIEKEKQEVQEKIGPYLNNNK